MLSGAKQAYIEDMVRTASPEQLSELRHNSEITLHEINRIAGRKVLSREEDEAFEVAIETLVRIEARENGKGWWFRAKRRAQLVATYMGSGGAIQGVGIKGVSSDHAVRLKTLMDLVVSKYLDMPTDELSSAIQRDFPSGQSAVENYTVTFVFSGTPEFQFYLDRTNELRALRNVRAMGRGELTGFTLFVNDGAERWFSLAKDGVFSAATGAAKALAKAMEKKYGIDDLSRYG